MKILRFTNTTNESVGPKRNYGQSYQSQRTGSSGLSAGPGVHPVPPEASPDTPSSLRPVPDARNRYLICKLRRAYPCWTPDVLLGRSLDGAATHFVSIRVRPTGILLSLQISTRQLCFWGEVTLFIFGVIHSRDYFCLTFLMQRVHFTSLHTRRRRR